MFGALREVFSPSSLIYIAVCVQIVRHLIWPRPSAFARLGELRVAIAARPHLAAALRAFFMTRPAVFIVAMVAVVTIGLTSTPGFVFSRDPIANLPARFDAGWYGGIALEGLTLGPHVSASAQHRVLPGAPAADAAGRCGARHYRRRSGARTSDAARALGRHGDLARRVLVGAVLRFAAGG